MEILEAANPPISFYTKLLGIEGRKQAGSRCYFECGPVTLQVLDVSSQRRPHPAAKALYFTVNNLEAVYERAKALHCLSHSDVHDAAGGGIVVRPSSSRRRAAQRDREAGTGRVPMRVVICFSNGTVNLLFTNTLKRGASTAFPILL